jgi:hypothetical protein
VRVPEAMRAARQWVVWKLEQRNGKGCKVPYQVSGRMASSTDPSHWCSYEEAQACCDANLSTYHGVGFVFSPTDDFAGIDLDNCIDGEWNLDEWARDVLAQVPSYTELSPSGKGLKIFLQGRPNITRGRKLEIPGKPGSRIEIYSSGRYFTVTGDQYGPHSEVMQCQAGLDWLTDVVMPEVVPEPPQALPNPTKPSSSPLRADNRPDAAERASLYARTYPPAVSGQDGHGVTFRLACVLVTGFGLGVHGARPILQAWNQGCQPPWSAKELEHKLHQAEAASLNRWSR